MKEATMWELRSDVSVSERIEYRVLKLALTLFGCGILTSLASYPAASSNF
jgi:hypothetical protein